MSEQRIFKGKIIHIGEQRSGSKKDGSEWHSLPVAIEENSEERFKEGMVVTLSKIEDIQSVKVGDIVEVRYNMKINEWNGRYFQNNDVWSLKKQGGQTMQPDTSFEAPKQTVYPTTTSQQENDDLPF